MTLPALLPRNQVHQRLQQIFPEGTPGRNYCIRELAASTVFVALYVGAIEGADVKFGPKHVYRMTAEQSQLVTDEDRRAYDGAMASTKIQIAGVRWYQDNTREPIRDETLRDGLIAVGAVIELPGFATTSGKPRYVLQEGFARLFDPALEGEVLAAAIADWQAAHLNSGTLARIALVRQGAAGGTDEVLVTYPNRETRRLKPGPSSLITKAVIEVFAPKFLGNPAVLFLSESGNKVVARDDALSRAIGINIRADKNLPDTILVDLAPAHPRLVFVEAVATDGPINERRKEALLALARDAGFPVEHTAFVTAYSDRSGSPFKKTVDTLAWGSYAWFVSEPDGLVALNVGRGAL